MNTIPVVLSSSRATSHVPLAALGYTLRRAEILAPLHDLALSIKTMDYPPADKWLTSLVLILAGGPCAVPGQLAASPESAFGPGLGAGWLC